MTTIKYTLPLLAALMASPASAELYLEAAFESGGDDLRTTSSGDSVTAGGGIKGAIGIQNRIGDTSSLRLALGYMFDSVDASNGTADISTLTLDAVFAHSIGPHTFGVGATMHMGPEYTEDSVFISTTVDFDDAVGLLLQYGYHFTPGMEVGVRYTDLTYEINSFKFDAASIGIYISNGF